ncbi:MAG: PepSY domain-containing protein [Nitrospirae bacterium]|nr:PepSY domain-containing protein [Nitrospirota bacterium]
MKMPFTPKGFGAVAAVLILMFTAIPDRVAIYGQSVPSMHINTVSTAYAANGQGDSSPYGGSKSGAYGEKKAVATAEDARKILKEYFSKKDVEIGEIKEKELYFEAEIRDKNNRPVDKVIVDKRTGRIRSIY